MGALDLFSSRRGVPSGSESTSGPRASTPAGEATATRVARTSGVLVLAAARSKLALGRATDGVWGPSEASALGEDPQAVCTCGSLISRVSSLLGGREADTCERCRFFGHYSQ